MAALLDGVRRIATTLRGYAYTDRHLVIHCLNGVASSPAVANAIADVWPMLCEHLSPAILPNRLVREQMVVALNNERAQHPNPVSTPVRAPR